MRILYLIDSLGAGGKERQLVELLKGLSLHKNIQCKLAVMSQNIHYYDLNGLAVELHSLIRKTKRDPTIFLKLYILCKELKADIIQTWDSMTSVYAIPVAKILGVKLVNGMIKNAPLKLPRFNKHWIGSKFTFPLSDAIVSNSYAGLKSYKVRSQKAICIHNGFDLLRLRDLKDKGTLREKAGIKTDKAVGMVASFSNNKDYET